MSRRYRTISLWPWTRVAEWIGALTRCAVVAAVAWSTGAAADETSTARNVVRGPEITVGPAGTQVVGRDERAIQTAIDALAYRGGGTVRVLPGVYMLRNSIFLRSHVRLVGDRAKTILQRAPVAYSRLAVDADIGQKEITPVEVAAFAPGMGVMLIGPNGGGRNWQPLWISAIRDGKLLLNDYNMVDYNAAKWAAVVSYFAMIRAYQVEDAEVTGFTVDATLDKVPREEEIRIGGVWLTFCRNCRVSEITVRGTQGDGILSEPGEHVSVTACESSRNTHHGIHFGSHSPWSSIVNCDLHDNGSDGLYLCWGVRESLVQGCSVYRNGSRLNRSGISLGHKDTDNVIEDNHVYDNYKYGIYFREKTEANGAHRNIVRRNLIENNGHATPGGVKSHSGCGICINGVTHDITLTDNAIRDTRSDEGHSRRHAVFLGPGVSRVTMSGNRMSGFEGQAVVDESGSTDNSLQKQ